jgi:uncharacterized protein (TIGR00730 family)
MPSDTPPCSICVFCSSSDALDAVYFDAAADLGVQIARRGCTLVYGGGKWGLMGAVARAAHAAEGRVVGVIPESLMAQVYPNADELIRTPDLRARKAAMEARADAFVVLPGGFGTLEELLEIVALKQLGYHTKPIVLLNVAGFFDGLLAVFEAMFRHHFANPAFSQLYHVTPGASDALAYVESYEPVALPDKVLGGWPERDRHGKGSGHG